MRKPNSIQFGSSSFGLEERKFGEGEFEVDSRLGRALAFHVRALLRNVGSFEAFSVRCVP